MKVYISADIEGTAGIATWDEARPSKPDYAQFRELMTREAIAACEGARAAGATEVWLRDGHNSARNILLEELPPYVKIIRGWSGSPMDQLQELDESFDAVLMTGWHARAGCEDNPLSHSINTTIESILLNDAPMSEFGLYARLAEYCNVPVVFIAGDAAVCDEAKRYIPSIQTAAVMHGVGASTISLAPQESRRLIRERAEKALQGDLGRCRQPLPQAFDVRVTYNNPCDAYQYAFYPGATLGGERTVRFAATDYFDIKRFLHFVTK